MKCFYPQINKLGLTIHNEPISHIKPEELCKLLSKSDKKKFDKFFGVQTMLVRDDGGTGAYPWDVEAVLEKMFSGRRIGTQCPALWD